MRFGQGGLYALVFLLPMQGERPQIGGFWMRAYRPGLMGGAEWNEELEVEREAKLQMYTARAQAHQPLFDPPPLPPSIQGMPPFSDPENRNNRVIATAAATSTPSMTSLRFSMVTNFAISCKDEPAHRPPPVNKFRRNFYGNGGPLPHGLHRSTA